MKPEEYLKRFEEITSSMLEITKAKNHDYSWTEDAFANFRMCENLWITSVENWILVRITDKLSRISTLVQTWQEWKVQDEKIADTLQDMANYAIILKIFLEEKQEVKDIEDKVKWRIFLKICPCWQQVFWKAVEKHICDKCHMPYKVVTKSTDITKEQAEMLVWD